jgi:YD repeat-containing protein
MVRSLKKLSVIVGVLAVSACSSENESSSTVGGAGGSDEGASGATGSGGDAGGGGASPFGPPDADCPALETPRLAPQVGPWLEGPDPGPCTSTDTEGTTTYEYDADGQLVSWEHTTRGSYTTTYDDQGRMTTWSGPDTYVSLTYRDDAVIETTAPSVNEIPTQLVTYEFDSTGRPIVASIDRNLDDLPGWIVTYLYDGCLLARREVAPGPSAADRGSEPLTLTYTFDDAGRLTTRAAEDGGNAVEFDYSCWSD